MIPINFSYHRPDDLSQLAPLMAKLAGQETAYYAGGSEIITMARAGSIAPEAVVDIKAIPECRHLGLNGLWLHIGAAVTLAKAADSGLFPLLGTTVSRIADHTNQCRITVGGNVCGTILYREAALPLLLADARALFWKDGQTSEEPLAARLQYKLRLTKSELLLGFRVPKEALMLPYAHIKRTRMDKIDYPLVTVAAQYTPESVRLAFAGLCGFPFRSPAMEKLAADRSLTVAKRVERMLNALPGEPLDDLRGGAAYRLATAGQVLGQIITKWEASYAQ